MYMDDGPRILLVSSAADETERLSRVLDRAGYQYRHTPCGGPDVKTLEDYAPDLVLLRTCGTGHAGLCTLTYAAGARSPAPYLVLSDDDAFETAVLAMRLGALDVLRSSVAEREILTSVRCALEQRRRLARATPGSDNAACGCVLGMIGMSPEMRRVWSLLLHVAPTSATVLLTGETGTGKEVAARAIHQVSPRKNGPWVPISCAALPEDLLESELFGHRRGSFTGAVSDTPGLLERASGGTVFLDEVETLTLRMQGKLLRTVEERTIQRIGSRHDIRVDFRLVAATNDDLRERVKAGSFREDLFFRLSVFPIEIPPLRFRLSDVPLLVEHFCEDLAAEAGLPPPEVPQSTLNRLMDHSWPGNVRELKHCVERAFILNGGRGVLELDVPTGIPADHRELLDACLCRGWDLERVEEEYIRAAVRRTGGHRSRAAGMLGIDRRTLYRKLKRIGLDS
ncbi:MAG TPA: sigma-54 dependent transcriptional regulator [Longimicrobiales bacterium]|nr:sigma-54 dependent transcriptional regulator [Longimicrobiales bacterium]